MNNSPSQGGATDSSSGTFPGASDSQGLGIAEIVGLIRSGIVQIAIITAVMMFLGMAFALIVTPKFTADGLVQVEDEGGKPGSRATSSNLAQLLSGTSAQVEAEIQVLSSRLVLDRVINKMNLLIGAEPCYFPVIGGAVSRFNRSAQEPVSAFLGLGSYAWGGEEINVTLLELPPALTGKRLVLKAGDGETYTVEDPDGVLLLKGIRGQEHLEQTPVGPVRILVARMKARKGTQFYIQRLAQQDVLASILGSLKVIQQGKDSGVIQLTYLARTADLAAETLNNIEDSYLEQNVDRRSAEAQSSLDFLSRQLPDLKSQVTRAQAKLNEYQIQHGSVDVTQETDQFVKQSTELEKQHIELIQQRDQALQRFTSEHPTVKAIDEQLRSISAEQEKQRTRATTLPETQQQILGLLRDVDVANQLYTAMLNSLQELEIQKAGTIGNVRIVDRALIPLKASSPNKKLVVLFAILMGLIIGVGYTILRQSFFSGIDDPWILEKNFGLPTYASVPFSRVQQRLSKRFLKANAPELILAVTDPTSPTIEAVKSLRSALHFASIEARNNIVMLTGPSPGLGKSFITMNLGAVLATGLKVVVVDCDLRRGRLSLYAKLAENTAGLSDVLLGQSALEQCIHKTSVANLNLMPIGSSRVLNSADLLMGSAFEKLLEDLSERFDHVLIDTPPVLALTDASIVGRRCGMTLVVIEAGQSSMREVVETCRRLSQTGTKVSGIVFNKVPSNGGVYGYGSSMNTYYNYT